MHNKLVCILCCFAVISLINCIFPRSESARRDLLMQRDVCMQGQTVSSRPYCIPYIQNSHSLFSLRWQQCTSEVTLNILYAHQFLATYSFLERNCFFASNKNLDFDSDFYNSQTIYLELFSLLFSNICTRKGVTIKENSIVSFSEVSI